MQRMYHQIKNILKKTAFKAASFEPFLNRMRKTRLQNRTLVLMYHELANDDDPVEAWTIVREGDFNRQMEYLSSYFNIVCLEDALMQMRGGGPPESDKPSAVITFDDGYAGNRRVLLPIVESIKVPATIFVASKAVEEGIIYWYDRLINGFQDGGPVVLDLTHLSLGRYHINQYTGHRNWNELGGLIHDLKTLEPDKRESVVEDILNGIEAAPAKGRHKISPLTLDELRELAASPYITIGAHSHCHNLLTQLPDDEVRTSVRRSKELIEGWIGRPVKYFAYPNGNYNGHIIEILKEEGFECALTTEERLWDSSEALHTIPRIGIGRYDTLDYFKIRVNGGLGKTNNPVA